MIVTLEQSTGIAFVFIYFLLENILLSLLSYHKVNSLDSIASVAFLKPRNQGGSQTSIP